MLMRSDTMPKWLQGQLPQQDVVISTRIRIARNINEYKFPMYMSLEEADKMTNELLVTFKDKFQDFNYRFLNIGNLSQIQRLNYIEGYLISKDLIQKADKSSFLLREDEKATVMINEEDHIRIQALVPGLDFLGAWQICSEIDDRLGSSINYAFHKDLGHLTACPTNVGTGMRASVMVHLPSISMTGNLNNMFETLRKVGLTARGIYGEGTEGIGNMYQISNQTTLGETEEDIMSKLNKIIGQIVNRERRTRLYLKEKKGIQLEDKIFRSFGILKNSRLLSSREAISLLSDVKLAYDMGYLRDESLKDLIKLMLSVNPATLQNNLGHDLDKDERDRIRAEIIREFMMNVEG